ncbi:MULTISPECIES: DUF1056 family protein [Bacillus cereus group]|uniref:DUF1056 family protein n=1 Tax=Bacillus cereus group TaxID=86661 RepID=UPI001F59F9D3|nr:MULTISPECIES: hypothetical protein [unclassified Bacillus cereus group]EMA6341692.1 hypothetical protein [Bacillus cytotoxicus]
MKKEYIKGIFNLIMLLLNDLLFAIGAILISITAYRIHLNAGLFVTGVFFMFYALLLSEKSSKGR